MRRTFIAGFLVAAGLFAASAMALEGHARTEGRAETDLDGRDTCGDDEREEIQTFTWWCTDLNELWHVDVPLVVGPLFLTPPDPSPLPPCPAASPFPVSVRAGSPWAVGNQFWITNRTYPPAIAEALGTIGYTFASESPMEDLWKKLVEVRYTVVTFPGNAVVAEYSFDPRRTFRLVRVGQLGDPRYSGPMVDPALGIDISADAVGRLPLLAFPRAIAGGLPPGSYRAMVYWVLSDLHNDGLGLAAGNFLSAGVTLYVQPRFIVVP